MDINNKDFQHYYKRQISVPSFGLQTQQKISTKKCLVVGLGGLGCPVALYLCVSGSGTIGLCDFDKIEFSNLGRQILFSPSDVGKYKSSVAQKLLQEKNPFICVKDHNTLLNESNITKIIKQYDLVLDCTDNFHIKYLIHDACLVLKKDLIQGALYQTQGHVISLPFSQNNFKGCLRCLWQKEPAGDCVQSCAEAGILSLVAGSVALRQATTALQYISGTYIHTGFSSLYSYNSQDWTNIPLPINKTCVHCTSPQNNAKIFEEALEINSMPNYGWRFLDVRNEKDQCAFFGNYSVEYVSDKERKNISLLAKKLDQNTHYVLICYAGVRSLHMCKDLRTLGFKKTHTYAKGYKHFLKNECISVT